MGWFIERVVSEGGLTNNNNYRSVSITISEDSPYNISIVRVGPIDIHRRVVH